MVTSSQPGTLDHMTLPVTLIALVSVICIIIFLVTTEYITVFINDYLNRVRSVKSNIASISEYLDS